ncbi:hypothetical protein FS749_008289 [Ceratobasidium sp. UAMH 11750]|nr:hypothetical protein FS749_008289 [Ceratobasidium sp. UAMH 11750]
MAAAVETPVNTADTNDTLTDEQRALQQFEFYFDDANLPYDKFMWKLHTQTPEHWIPIATVASFKRMREFQPKGTEWLVDILRKSDGLLEVDESGTNVRRARELHPPKDQFDRSVYAKGFPDETPDLQIRLEKYFAQFGQVNAVRMRRTDQKVFKNSVFVEFASFDSVKRFLEADPKPTFDDTELVTMSKEAYCTMKIKEKGLDKKGITPRTHSGSGGAGGRRQFDAFQLKDGVIPEGKKKPEKEPVTVTFHGKTYNVNSEGKVDIALDAFEYVKGSAIKFTGAGSDEPKFGEIKIPLKERFNPLPFIKMDKGASEGIFGFGATLTEEDLAFLREKVPKIAGGQVTWEPLSDEEERAFHFWRLQDQAKRALADSEAPSRDQKSTRGGRGGSRGGGRGRGGRNGGGRDRNDNKRDSKPKSAKNEPKEKDKDKEMAEPVEALKAGKTQGEIEPSGEGAGQGVRGTGAGVPTVGVGKRKAEEEVGGDEKKAKAE